MTATRNPAAFVKRHIVDALELSRDIPREPARMLDVGSGGGLPGLVLAIVHPEMSFTLIEPIKKKHAFLSAARRELKLGNLTTLAVRDEELLAQPDFAPFDFAVARAVWGLDEWLMRARDLVRPEGTIFGMEGREECGLPEGASRRRYQLDGGRERAIVTLTVQRIDG